MKVIRNVQENLALESAPDPPRPVPLILTGRASPVPTAVFDTYWRFAGERQQIFFRRIEQNAWPLTSDPILRAHKFTNVYRASDRVSQFLIRNVIYRGDPSPDEVFFRTLLFKFFNRTSTWDLLERELGEVRWDAYRFESYDAVLTGAMEENAKIYSPAYIIPSPPFGHKRKHQNHLRLLESMLADQLPAKLGETRSMQAAFDLLRAYPSLGDFLAYQLTIDLNYGPIMDHPETEFVVPGPGAKDGIRKCFADLAGTSEPDIIRMMMDRQEQEFERVGIEFRSLWGRELQLIDCQNLFCEVDKYARIAHPDIQGISGRTRIKQQYRPSSEPIEYWYPPKWGLNERANPTSEP
jgi:hypothetical protein